jgi:hypothetical protein
MIVSILNCLALADANRVSSLRCVALAPIVPELAGMGVKSHEFCADFTTQHTIARISWQSRGVYSV